MNKLFVGLILLSSSIGITRENEKEVYSSEFLNKLNYNVEEMSYRNDGRDLMSFGINHAQFRGKDTVFVWTSDKAKRLDVLTQIRTNSEGKVVNVIIANWAERIAPLVNPAVVYQLNDNKSVTMIGPFRGDYETEKNPPSDASRKILPAETLQKFQEVYDAMRTAAKAYRTAPSGQSPGLYANLSIHAMASLKKACSKSTPREMYFATPDDSQTADILFKHLKEKYPSISPSMEASNYMKAVCEEENKK